MGVPALSEVGVFEDRFRLIGENAMLSIFTRSNPQPIREPQDVVQILRLAAWFGGFSAPLANEVCCVSGPLRLKSGPSTERAAMAHNYAINDDVHHQLQGPQGRAGVKQRSIYTIVTCLPIEADGRPRYRIKSKTENVERVVTEEQISRLG
jgi:hypothetical protein